MAIVRCISLMIWRTTAITFHPASCTYCTHTYCTHLHSAVYAVHYTLYTVRCTLYTRLSPGIAGSAVFGCTAYLLASTVRYFRVIYLLQNDDFEVDKVGP